MLLRRIPDMELKGYALHYPYKLCDYKPTYGVLFAEYLKNYDYWGYIDCDLVFGNLSKYLKNIGIAEYDRIYSAGHLSIYRNCKEINELFLESFKGLIEFKSVCGTSMIHNFDETVINDYFRRKGLKYYDAGDDATFGIYCSEYKWRNADFPSLGELFVKAIDGSTYAYIEHKDGSVEKHEVNYIHFMTKKDVTIPLGQNRPYCITRRGVLPFDEKFLSDLINSTKSDAKTEKEFVDWQVRQFKNKTYQKIFRELKYNKFRVIVTLTRRIPTYIKYLMIVRKHK